MNNFLSRLGAIHKAKGSLLCVGLDPDLERMPTSSRVGRTPGEAVKYFLASVIESTAPYACAFKLNFAFFEALGAECYDTLSHTLNCIPNDVVTIADAKRGDIGNSARQYARAIFEDLNFDACTVAPYMGKDAVAPFLSYPDKAAFILARTSNRSSRDFQTLCVGSTVLSHVVATHISDWDSELPGTAGLVVGATSPSALRSLRDLCPSLPFLIPGVGAQKGSVSDIAAAASGPIIVNSSRAILYASTNTDFAESASAAARATHLKLSELDPN